MQAVIRVPRTRSKQRGAAAEGPNVEPPLSQRSQAPRRHSGARGESAVPSATSAANIAAGQLNGRHGSRRRREQPCQCGYALVVDSHLDHRRGCCGAAGSFVALAPIGVTCCVRSDV
jgi:hypothetical protein